MDSGVKVINRDILIICTSKEVSTRSDYEDPISEGKAYCDWLGTSSGGKVKYKKCQKLKMLLKKSKSGLARLNRNSLSLNSKVNVSGKNKIVSYF